jgi:hypothetical protein
MLSPSPQVTQLLMAWSHGDQDAFAHLLPLIYNMARIICEVEPQKPSTAMRQSGTPAGTWTPRRNPQ